MKLLRVIQALALLSATVLGTHLTYAKTCMAPSHPECVANCPMNCAAIYVEKDGPCLKSCSSTEILPGALSLSIDGLTPDQLKTMLSQPQINSK